MLIGWTSFFVTGEPTARKWLLTALVSIWGIRLGGYLAWRARGRGEDFRYANMRRSQGRFTNYCGDFLVWCTPAFFPRRPRGT